VLKTGWESGTTGKYLRWISKYGSVTLNMAGYQLVWGGMNEEGTSCLASAAGEMDRFDGNPSPVVGMALAESTVFGLHPLAPVT